MLIGKSVGLGTRDLQSRIVCLAFGKFSEHGQAFDDLRLFQQMLKARCARMTEGEPEPLVPRARKIDFGRKLFK